MKRLEIPQKLMYKECYVREQILRARKCRRKFIENLLPEKFKKNI